MKRTIITLASVAFLAMGSVGLVSCGSESTEQHNHDEHAEYECPMDCEHGKKYDEMGTCPVCKMDLEVVEDE
jgi:hypothetical protein